jgi:GT2 family glycosyltransferase
MTVAVIGMHRSGTSLVAKLLHLCGTYLGPESDLVPATPDNPDGHWEHTGFLEINETILGRLGGGWDRPPLLPTNWIGEPSMEHPRAKARRLIAEFGSHEPWGWKDPRTTLTLPFWLDLLPNLRVIVCLRNPLEVALSMHRRGLCSHALGLELWQTYNDRVLDTTRPEGRLVTHYASFFPDPTAEVERLCAFLGLGPSPQALRACQEATKFQLRHHCFTRRHLGAIGVVREIVEPYQRLCDESGYDDGAPIPAGFISPGRADGSTLPMLADVHALEAEVRRQEAEVRRQEATRLQAVIGQREAALDGAQRQLEQAEAKERRLEDVVVARDGSIQDLQRQLDGLQQQLEGLRQELSDMTSQRDGQQQAVADKEHELRQVLDRQAREAAEHETQLQALRDELAGRDKQIQHLQAQLRAVAAPTEGSSPHRLAYLQTIDRIRGLVREHAPRGSIVAVVSKGDDELLRLDDCVGWHFPRNEDGVYAGYYPANGRGAIVQVEVMRARGARFLMLPSTASWWLETYPELRTHLATRYRELARLDGAGALYDLAVTAGARNATPTSVFADVVARFRGAHERAPAVLDWNSGQALAVEAPGLAVFTSPSSNGRLPYVDGSIDIVAVATNSEELLAEARRVAATAIVNFALADNGERRVTAFWLREPEAKKLPTASIIVPVFNQWRHTSACLAALRETLPRKFNGEILVIDDASTDETSDQLAQLAAVEPQLRVFRNATNGGFIEACRLGAAAAVSEFLIFLNNDTVPLADWLPPLLGTFEQFPSVGAVGGKLLFPDGRLQEAGGIIFRDGSAAHFGRGNPAPSHGLFSFVREVDYCSGALLATPRALFEQLGGFDEVYRPGYFEDTDYCFRLRNLGFLTFYQPDSEVVHVEGATAGTDLSRGMKQHQQTNCQRFRERWWRELAEQPQRPVQFDSDAWYTLARRGRGWQP